MPFCIPLISHSLWGRKRPRRVKNQDTTTNDADGNLWHYLHAINWAMCLWFGTHQSSRQPPHDLLEIHFEEWYYWQSQSNMPGTRTAYSMLLEAILRRTNHRHYWQRIAAAVKAVPLRFNTCFSLKVTYGGGLVFAFSWWVRPIHKRNFHYSV